MTQAAKNAGIGYVELVYEPQCAVAYYTYKIMERTPSQLEVGSVITVPDIGGGTGDFVSYRITTHGQTGAGVGLEMVGKATGEQLVQWLVKDSRTLDSNYLFRSFVWI